uniref:Fucosyltransferase n=1 Tax=Leersia perrieri TaxID=77586 RepID=A0A0D9WN69_9ORYZ
MWQMCGAVSTVDAAHQWPKSGEDTAPTKRLARKEWSCGSKVALVAFIMIVPPMVVLHGDRLGAPAVWISSANFIHGNGSMLHWPAAASRDRLLGGLLADGFDEGSCRSRYQSAMYRRNAGKEPSAHLVSKLRRQEDLQRRCGPGTVAYSNAVEYLRSRGKSGGGGIGSPECRYLVSISYRGLGNRMLATASAFLYAMLTDRVLLVDPSNEMDELFCEPFPDATWLLPRTFPLTNYTTFNVNTTESYGNMLKNNTITPDRAGDVPAFAYVHLDHDYTMQDKFFFCNEDQSVLQKIPWLVMRTDCYIVPGIFLLTRFHEELDMLFPDRVTVFHHLARYLFHPNNQIWGLVTRYYDAYLATAQQRVGIQVRVFGAQPNLPSLLEQVTKCTKNENLLPEVITGGDGGELVVAPTSRRRSKSIAVLVASLKSWYYEQIKSMYWEHATATGETPSHEEYQRFGSRSHDAKACAEIYLLSLSDALVTSGGSTFGYVAQGLGGVTPWVMHIRANDTDVPNPPCRRDMSMEPCFLTPPAFNDCRGKRSIDPGNVVPHVQSCHDVPWGVKLQHQHEATIGHNGAAPPWKEQNLAAHKRTKAEEGAPAFPSPMKSLVHGAFNVMLVAFIMIVPPMVVLYSARASSPAVWLSSSFVDQGSSGDGSVLHRTVAAHDKLLGGLLADGFDERSCHSRYQSATYRRNAGREPSPHLVSKLRQHEALQRRCGPGTVAYSNAVESLRSGKSGGGVIGSPECRYLVSMSYRGLGNRMLATASAFLYAMLTDRVLLVDPSNEMDELFCEPFPDTTWVLPPGFPLTNYTDFSVRTAESYGNMLKNNVIKIDAGGVPTSTHQQLPVFAYVHLDHDYTVHDKYFFCDDDQRVLRDIQWLVMRTDCYIVPGLFLLTGFRDELDMLFPERVTVFHHLARYLFHPNNHIWGLITRYYDAYLATARQRVGIQVRVFGSRQELPKVLEQITACTHNENLLPDVITDDGEPFVAQEPHGRIKPKAVLVTSLSSWYYEKLKSMYWEHAASTGETVGVHQPSHEEYQHFGSGSHDAKACAEIYLLSLSDVLVTSGWSTFGYVAQGLAGLTPWVMYKPWNESSPVPDPPCRRDVSMEPCFLSPPYSDCRMKRSAHSGKVVPHVQNCEDVPWGLKLVDRVE